MISYQDIHNRMRELGYKVFEAPDHNMNVVGLRKQSGRANTFDDLMTLTYTVGGKWRFHAWPCTTDPGGKYLGKPMNMIGTAIVKPGQYRGSHKLGIHGASKSWAHEALVQCGTLKVWHDANKDEAVDYGLAETTSYGTSGLNIHRNLGDFSAGCQVFRDRVDFDEFMHLAKLQINGKLGNRYTYTLLDWLL